MDSTLDRIRTTTRAAVPLPPPPKLSDFSGHAVILKAEAEKYDEAVAEWWRQVQLAQDLNKR